MALYQSNALERLHTINLNLLNSHKSYYITYKFICKLDKSVLHSDEHQDLQMICPPKTKHFIKVYQRKYKLNKTETSQEKQK